MKIVIATHNPSKFARYKNTLGDITHIDFLSLTDFNITEKADEPYSAPGENALYKAKFYANLSRLPTLAIDEAVSTNFLPENEQPGVYVRRFASKDKEMSDKESLDVWRNIFKKYKDPDKKFIWDYSIAYFDPVKHKNHGISVTAVVSVTTNFSTTVIPGYPMSSFMIYDGTNKPHAALTPEERIQVDKLLLRDFVNEFKKWIIE